MILCQYLPNFEHELNELISNYYIKLNRKPENNKYM